MIHYQYRWKELNNLKNLKIWKLNLQLEIILIVHETHLRTNVRKQFPMYSTASTKCQEGALWLHCLHGVWGNGPLGHWCSANVTLLFNNNQNHIQFITWQYRWYWMLLQCKLGVNSSIRRHHARSSPSCTRGHSQSVGTYDDTNRCAFCNIISSLYFSLIQFWRLSELHDACRSVTGTRTEGSYGRVHFIILCFIGQLFICAITKDLIWLFGNF